MDFFYSVMTDSFKGKWGLFLDLVGTLQLLQYPRVPILALLFLGDLFFPFCVTRQPLLMTMLTAWTGEEGTTYFVKPDNKWVVVTSKAITRYFLHPMHHNSSSHSFPRALFLKKERERERCEDSEYDGVQPVSTKCAALFNNKSRSNCLVQKENRLSP